VKALALFVTLVAAKLIGVAGRDLPWSAWTLLALFWQDALVALLFASADFALRKKPLAWAAYWGIVIYTAVNAVLTRILSSPMTWQMSRATGGALADSIRHYLTPANLALMSLVVVVAAAASASTRKLRPSWTRAGLVSLGMLMFIGAFGAGRVDCSGQHRNALVALVESVLPHVQSRLPASPRNWRAATTTSGAVEDFTSLRGSAAGRNVVLIALESTGARALKSYGATADPTPHLTKLAATSLLFENAYAVYPESIKGLFSVLCSRYPAFDTQAGDCARVRTPAIGERLAASGYRTALFHSGRFMYLGMNAVIQHRGFETLEDAGAIGGNFNSSFGVDEPATVERMLSWIDGLPRGQRFFLHYLPIAGHHPYATPDRGPFSEQTDASQYLNALHFGDAALGMFLDGLRRRGLETNTLFVIYGDHGEAFGQHEGNYGHTLFIYEENIRVPLLIAMPGAWREGKRSSKMASLVDVAPTLLDLAGISAPPDYQGTSLLTSRDPLTLFFTDYSLPLAGIREGRWKLILEPGTSRIKLFDLESDPLETHNVAAKFPGRVKDWRTRLEEWTSAQKALMRQPDWVARNEKSH